LFVARHRPALPLGTHSFLSLPPASQQLLGAFQLTQFFFEINTLHESYNAFCGGVVLALFTFQELSEIVRVVIGSSASYM
jgi:hypothetical protein